MLHCIAMQTGPRLNRLRAELRAGLGERLGGPGQRPPADDPRRPEAPLSDLRRPRPFGTAHWKLEALDEYARERPLAWIDDSLDPSCYEWAAAARGPTLLVPTESDVGLTDAQVEALEAWVARRLRTPG